MNAIQLLLLSVLIFGLGGLASLLLNRIQSLCPPGLRDNRDVGLCDRVDSCSRCRPDQIQRDAHCPSRFPSEHFVLEIDGLSALMVGLIAVIGFAASLYSISYLEKYEHRSLGVLGFFTNIFIATMLLVVTVANGFYFLLFWEMMTLASYFLIIFEIEKKEAIRAGYLYMLVAHAGGFSS